MAFFIVGFKAFGVTFNIAPKTLLPRLRLTIIVNLMLNDEYIVFDCLYKVSQPRRAGKESRFQSSLSDYLPLRYARAPKITIIGRKLKLVVSAV